MASDIAGSTGSNEIFRHWFLSPLSSVFVSSTPFTDCLPPLLVAIWPSFHPRSFLPSSKCGSLLPRIPSNLIASHWLWLCHMSVSEPISVALMWCFDSLEITCPHTPGPGEGMGCGNRIPVLEPDSGTRAGSRAPKRSGECPPAES